MISPVRALAAVSMTAVFALSSPGLAQQAPAPSAAASPASGPTPGPGAVSLPLADPYPSTYTAFPSRATLIRNATLLTAAGPVLRNGSILLRNGKIVAVGANVAPPPDGADVIDGTGKYVTPGIIDIHSH